MQIDYIIIGAFSLILIGTAFYMGRSRMIALIASTYIGILLYGSFPWVASLVPDASSALFATGIGYGLLSIFIGLAYLAMAPAVWEGFGPGPYGEFFPAVLLGVGWGVLLLLIAHFQIPIDSVYKLPAILNPVFSFTYASFWLLIPPLIAIFVASRR